MDRIPQILSDLHQLKNRVMILELLIHTITRQLGMPEPDYEALDKAHEESNNT